MWLFSYVVLFIEWAEVCYIWFSIFGRISMSDIAQKLLLDSAEDAEYIVAKVGQEYRTSCG